RGYNEGDLDRRNIFNSARARREADFILPARQAGWPRLEANCEPRRRGRGPDRLAGSPSDQLGVGVRPDLFVTIRDRKADIQGVAGRPNLPGSGGFVGAGYFANVV